MPARAAQSIPSPGPPVSVMPMMSNVRMRSSCSMRARSSSDHISEPKMPTRSDSESRSNRSSRAASISRKGYVAIAATTVVLRSRMSRSCSAVRPAPVGITIAPSRSAP